MVEAVLDVGRPIQQRRLGFVVFVLALVLGPPLEEVAPQDDLKDVRHGGRAERGEEKRSLCGCLFALIMKRTFQERSLIRTVRGTDGSDRTMAVVIPRAALFGETKSDWA